MWLGHQICRFNSIPSFLDESFNPGEEDDDIAEEWATINWCGGFNKDAELTFLFIPISAEQVRQQRLSQRQQRWRRQRGRERKKEEGKESESGEGEKREETTQRGETRTAVEDFKKANIFSVTNCP